MDNMFHICYNVSYMKHLWYINTCNDYFMKHRNLPLAQLDRATAF